MKEILIEKNAYLPTNSRLRKPNVPASLVATNLSLSKASFANPKLEIFALKLSSRRIFHDLRS